MKRRQGRPKKNWVKFSSTLSPEAYDLIYKIKKVEEQVNHFFDRLIKKEAKELDIK
jgi:hypothetical protein